jgi:hypothetical protein
MRTDLKGDGAPKYTRTLTTSKQFIGTGTWELVVSENPNRKWMYVYNGSTMYQLALSSTPGPEGYLRPLLPGDGFLFGENNPYKGPLYAGGTATALIDVFEVF